MFCKVIISPDGRFALSGNGAKAPGELTLWDVASGTALRNFAGHKRDIASVAFSPDSRFALSGSEDKTMKLWDISTGKEIRTFSGFDSSVEVAISPDGRFAPARAGMKNPLSLWDLATGIEVRRFHGFVRPVRSIAFSPDGRWALSSGCDDDSDSDGILCGEGSLKLWNVSTGELLRSFTGHSNSVYSAVFSPDGRFVLSVSHDQTMKLWDVASGKELRSFGLDTDFPDSLAYSPDGRFALVSGTGAMQIWDIEKGREAARMMATTDGEWLTITPEGFFSASRRDTGRLVIVRGTAATAIGQLHQSLLNPDLVREALAGDPDGEIKRAAEAVNLDKVLDAGPPPAVTINSHGPGSRSSTDLVTVEARIADRGKGIGRIEWRVNGVTAGVTNAPAGHGPEYNMRQELALDLGENRIEVIAYEGRNLLASLPAQTTIVYDGPANAVKPKLYILAIGIDRYVDRGWSPPGSGKTYLFPALTGSVADATAFSAEMEKAGAGQYAEVRVTLALNADATAAKLDRTVTKIASEISPRDTFVLYMAAHGYTVDGNYYMIPQDYQGGPEPGAIKARAIGQNRIQDWIANRIKAKRALILLDTCESGALTAGYTKSRTEGPVSEAAVGRLHEATGRPVLTAASGGKSAYEGYKGHGVFTYALMEALHKGDTNGNGKIEVTELAAHVEKRVPELFAELKANGWVVKGVTVAARGASGDAQSAHFGSIGEDFSVVARLP